MSNGNHMGPFERAQLDPASFSHAHHVRYAFDLLAQNCFINVLGEYSASIRELAAKAGNPEKYNATITTAFLALIAERMANGWASYDEFARQNADLFRKQVLSSYYSDERLGSRLARSTFLLPDRSGMAVATDLPAWTVEGTCLAPSHAKRPADPKKIVTHKDQL